MTALAARRVEAAATAGRLHTELVHALAQLPAEVTLDLDAGPGERATLELLARAYGVEQRLRLSARGEGPPPGFAGAAAATGAPAASLGELVESLWPAGAHAAVPHGDDSLLGGHRIALLTKTPSHYRIPLFDGLADRVARAGGELRIFFLSANPETQPWLTTDGHVSFEHETVAASELPAWVPIASELDRGRAPAAIPRALGRRLRAFDPSMVLCGSFAVAGIAAQAFSSRRGVPFGLWSGEIAAQAGKRSYPALRARQRRWLARRADFGVAYGSAAARYLADLSPGLPVVLGRNTSVTDVPGSRPHRQTRALELLTVADLSVPGKGLDVVVDALARVQSAACRLRVVGTPPAPGGPLARAAARDARIEFLGPRPHSEVGELLASSDVFVFPSRVDIFGLALVEAMAAGLPAITSGVPGVVADLARAGRNCLVAADDADSWAGAIVSLTESSDLRASMGAAAQDTVRRRWTMAHAVEGMTAGLRLGALRAGGRA
jgi:glycosyltransferase involved in cell wall biosynthesis